MRDWLGDRRLVRVLTQDGNVEGIASDFRSVQRGNHEITRHTAGEASIRALQRALILLGYSTSVGGGFVIDGDFGRGTNRGLAQFRFDHDLPSVGRETLCYPCTFSTAHRLIVSIPDVPFDAPALERMADAVLEAVEAKRITFGDFDLALEHLNRLHGGRLMSCREILERYGELAAQAAGRVFAESGSVVHTYWMLAIIRQETAGVVRPRFEQHKLSRYAADQPSGELAELRYRAMSLGLGQIMGNNYSLVGAGSARAMMQSPIEDQVLFIGRFLARSRALRHSLATEEPAASDFAKVARYYNGPGYAGHFYHESLERWFNELKSLAREGEERIPAEYDESAPCIRRSRSSPAARRLDEAAACVKQPFWIYCRDHSAAGARAMTTSDFSVRSGKCAAVEPSDNGCAGVLPLRRTALCSAVALLVAAATQAHAQSSADVPIDGDDIGGVVTSSNGPEAGVWVIAETDEFDTRFAKIVVTDDEGRYVVPDLPDGNYEVWVRGYGLADSEKVEAAPGQQLDLTAVTAGDPAVAAQVYPASYWYSMMKLPTEDEVAHLPGGVNQYLATMKNLACVGCHQLGQLATRTIPHTLGEFESSVDAWTRRLQSGQAGGQMIRTAAGQLAGVPFRYLADWTDRIEAGALPRMQPERPSGIERNVVATVRDWATEKVYMHDLSSTDRRDPTVNPYGKIYGAPELSTDDFPILDPVANTATSFHAPVRDADTPTTAETPPVQPSPYWGNETIWDSKANAHNPMFDHTGRVWYTARIRGPENPSFCREGSEHPSAKLTPTERTSRHLAVYEPDTGDYTFIDTCFSTHHLQFAEDENHTLWTSGGGPVVGWLNTKMFDETGDAEKSQGWTALVLDTNGNGRRDEYVEADQPLDPARDKRIDSGFYAVMPSPADGSVWGSAIGYPGAIIRLDPGSNPPETALAEIYNVPMPGFGARGADIDRNGVVWVSLGSGHLGEFDRRKCEGPLNGPEATGDHCPEGWTFHRYPGPGFDELPEFSVESSYYSWVDQHDTLGLGENVPMSTANLFDGVHALVDDEFVTLRIPYPLGFYSKGFDGRIDDPDAGWKGRGLWVPSGDRTPWLMEGGTENKPLVVHFQVRPDPLAK